MEHLKLAYAQSKNRVWYLLLVLFTATAVSLPLFGNIDHDGYILLGLLLALFVEYAALVWFIPIDSPGIKPATYVAVGLIALVFLFAKPLFSTDVYRYIWDGGLSLHGINPYTIKPVDVTEPALLTSGLLAHQGFPNEYAIYPPLAQVIFVLSYATYSFSGLTGAKIIFALPLFLLWILMREHLSARSHILFILNPLLLFETFNGAHIDLWAIFFLVFAWQSLIKKSYTFSAFALGASVVTKIYPIIFVPLFARHIYKTSNLRVATSFLFLCGGVVALAYLPLFPHFVFIVERYRAWVSDMQFNAALYSLLQHIFGLFAVNPVEYAQRASALCIVILIGLFSRLQLTSTVMLATSIAFISFSSVVFPWYTAALVPFVFLMQENRKSNTMLYLLVIFQALVTSTYLNEVVYAATLHGSNAITIISIIEYIFLYGVIAWYVVAECRQDKTQKKK